MRVNKGQKGGILLTKQWVGFFNWLIYKDKLGVNGVVVSGWVSGPPLFPLLSLLLILLFSSCLSPLPLPADPPTTHHAACLYTPGGGPMPISPCEMGLINIPSPLLLGWGLFPEGVPKKNFLPNFFIRPSCVLRRREWFDTQSKKRKRKRG